jgi:DNA-binding MarR family transcriptional regulator
LRGPIPWPWLTAAGCLPGKALHVAIVLWHIVGLRKSRTVKWQPSKAKPFGMDRHTLYRALNQLEKAGLISVKRLKGRSPIVTLLEHSASEVLHQ